MSREANQSLMILVVVVVASQSPEPVLCPFTNQAVATLGPHRGKSDSESSVFPFRADRNRSILNC